MSEPVENINNILSNINNNLVIITDKLINIEKKLAHLETTVEENIIIECKKMGSHINFVETVYENVKHPLGFINNKIKEIIGSNNLYTLDNIEYNNNKLKNATDDTTD